MSTTVISGREIIGGIDVDVDRASYDLACVSTNKRRDDVATCCNMVPDRVIFCPTDESIVGLDTYDDLHRLSVSVVSVFSFVCWCVSRAHLARRIFVFL